MRHLNRVKKLNRTKSHRRALLMNLTNALFYHERIKTTLPKAVELRRVADRLITMAKRKDLHSMRLAFAFLRDKGAVKKLFTDIGDRYASINGGYTRVLKIGRRKGDAAFMALIELTQRQAEAAAEVAKGKKTKRKQYKKGTKGVKENRVEKGEG